MYTFRTFGIFYTMFASPGFGSLPSSKVQFIKIPPSFWLSSHRFKKFKKNPPSSLLSKKCALCKVAVYQKHQKHHSLNDFSTKVLFLNKSGIWFLNCLKKTCGRVIFYVKMQAIDLHIYVKCHSSTGVFQTIS